MPIPVLSVIGHSGSGKTTLMEKLISELSRRGYRVATIKHHSHAGFEIDQPGKDSFRHAQAGSVHVVIAAPDKIASYRLLQEELGLSEIVEEIGDADLILVEGYQRSEYPSLEVYRPEVGTDLIGDPMRRIAVASLESKMDARVPCLRLDDSSGISDLIEEKLLRSRRKGTREKG